MSYFVEVARLVILGSVSSSATTTARAPRPSLPTRVFTPLTRRARSTRRAATAPSRSARYRALHSFLRSLTVGSRRCRASVRLNSRDGIVRGGSLHQTFTSAILLSVIKHISVHQNWMCTGLESVSTAAPGPTTLAGHVDFCKLISPVQTVSEKLLIKSFTGKRNGRKVILRKYI